MTDSTKKFRFSFDAIRHGVHVTWLCLIQAACGLYAVFFSYGIIVRLLEGRFESIPVILLGIATMGIFIFLAFRKLKAIREERRQVLSEDDGVIQF